VLVNYACGVLAVSTFYGNLFQRREEMNKLWVVIMVLAATTMSYATLINDFESYANTLALAGEWTKTANMTISLDTTYVHSGSKAMKYVSSNGSSPWYGKSEYRLPGIVWGTSGQDWTGMDTVSLWYKVAGASDGLKVAIVDCYGSNLYVYDAGKMVIGDWKQLNISLASLTPAQLSNVGRIDLVVSSINYGTNTVYFDDITVTPEPATMALLGLGGLAMFRRK
jgi:hypothetical protein